MSDFKEGDKVHVVRDTVGYYSQKYVAGTVGTIEEWAGVPEGYSYVDLNGSSYIGCKYIRTADLALVTPEVKEGDTVRVVLEGKAAYVRGGAEFEVGTDSGTSNHIWPSADHVKSVEVIKKAEPVYKDGDVLEAKNGQRWIYSRDAFDGKSFIYIGYKDSGWSSFARETKPTHPGTKEGLKVVGNISDFLKGL